MKEPVILNGKVVRGKALGRTVGMPTANLCVTEGTMPEEGVYATRILIDGQSYISVTNIGRRPTVDDESYITVETFIIDFSGDLYGKTISVYFIERIRDIVKFNSWKRTPYWSPFFMKKLGIRMNI